MSRGRKPEGPQAMSGAERQALPRSSCPCRRGLRSRARVASPDRPRVEQRAGRAPGEPAPALARGHNRAPHPAGRIRRLARRLAGGDSRQRHRRSPPGHRRPGPRRDRRHRSTARLRTRLALQARTCRRKPAFCLPTVGCASLRNAKRPIRLQPQVSQRSAKWVSSSCRHWVNSGCRLTRPTRAMPK
jgi:hypothetical protein